MVYKDIKHDLNFYPKLRERKNKNWYIAVKLQKKYHTGLSIDKLIEIAVDAATLDRGWRYCLQHYPHLRGTDYEDKKVLEQAQITKLGYQGGVDVDEFKDVVANF